MPASLSQMWPIMAAVLLGSMGFTAMTSVVGPTMRVLGFPDWYAGAFLSVAGLFVMIFSPIWGHICRVHGQKITLWVGLMGQGSALIALAIVVGLGFDNLLAPSVVILGMVACRSAMSAFYAAVSVSANSWVAERTTSHDRTRSLAKLGAAQGIGMIVGPALAAVAATRGLLEPMWLGGVIPLLAAILVLLKMPRVAGDGHVDPDARLRLRDPRIRLPMLTAFSSMVVIVSAQLTVGFMAMDFLGQTAHQAGTTSSISLACLGTAVLLAQLLVSRMQLPPKRWIQIGAFMAAAGIGVTPFLLLSFANSFVMWSGLSLGGFGIGMMMPAIQSAAAGAVSDSETKEAAGLVSAAMGAASVCGPIVVSFFYSIKPLFAFSAIALLLLLTGLAWTTKRKEGTQARENAPNER